MNLDYWDGNIDWYSPAEIIDQIYVDRSQRKITELGFEKSSAKMLPEGTVLFTSRAGIGKTAILAKKGCTNQGFQSIVPHSNKLDSYFIFSRTEELKKYGELVGAGSTFVEVSGRQMENMQLMIPKTIGEQHIIGVLFSTVDHLITLHQSKSFGHILKAIVSCTLSWEQRKLGEVCNIITKQTGFDYSSTIKPALLKEKADDSYPFIQNKDFNGTKINMDTDFFIPIDIAEKFPNIVLDRSSILISISGRIGNVGFYSSEHKAFIGGAVGICKLKYDNDGEFIIRELESEYGQKYFYSLIKASSHANITVEDIRNMELIFPEKKEEKICISTFFSSFNHLITLHQLEPFQLIFKAIAYRIIDYTKSKSPRHTKYEIIISFIKYYL